MWQVDLKNINYRYEQRGLAGLNNLNFSIAANSFHALLGASGSGKTTLLKLLCADIKATSGTAQLIDPKDITMIKSELSLTFEGSLFDFMEQTLTGVHVDQVNRINAIRSILDNFDIIHLIDEAFNHLSTGQKQRALLAKNLLAEPKLLLLDEPFKHLDGNLQRELISFLKSYQQKKEISVLWVTHQQHLALAFAETLHFIHHGEILQSGTPKKLYSKPQNLEVAQFFGSNNIFAAHSQSGSLGFANIEIPFSDPFQGHVLIMIRAENIEICQKGYQAVVVASYFEGCSYLYHVKDSQQNEWWIRSQEQLSIEQNIHFHFAPDSVHVIAKL